MRVLEIGPWNYPAEGHITDPKVSQYVGVDLGVWEGSIEGNNADVVFDNAAIRLGLDRSKVDFFRMPVSSYNGGGGKFDLIYAANVLGDLRAIPKNPDGSIKYDQPTDEVARLVDSIGRLANDGGTIDIVETYTPIKRFVLEEVMGRDDTLELVEFIDGGDLIRYLQTVYISDWKAMSKRIDPMVRLKAALRHNLEDGVTSPYLVRYSKKVAK